MEHLPRRASSRNHRLTHKHISRQDDVDADSHFEEQNRNIYFGGQDLGDYLICAGRRAFANSQSMSMNRSSISTIGFIASPAGQHFDIGNKIAMERRR
jgi:hypothetical protein